MLSSDALFAGRKESRLKTGSKRLEEGAVAPPDATRAVFEGLRRKPEALIAGSLVRHPALTPMDNIDPALLASAQRDS